MIPSHLRIRILYDDIDIIVINKPCNLRSVPGHAKPPPSNKRKRPDAGDSSNLAEGIDSPDEVGDHDVSTRRKGNEAWTLAILSFRSETPSWTNERHSDEDVASSCLRRLAMNENLAASVPRKQKLFLRYLMRNQKRLNLRSGIFPEKVDSKQGQQTKTEGMAASKLLEQTAEIMYTRLLERQKQFLNLPEPTRHEDSAFGQLILLGYDGDKRMEGAGSSNLRIVHRLDCETSGVMVFAKNDLAAANLSRDWRERNGVVKEYVAFVKHWPPFHVDGQREGRIDLMLSPSKERLKWKVVSSGDDGYKDAGKLSTTLWKVRQVVCHETDVLGLGTSGVILDLVPVTGRTHQLRVHSAHVGSGILGDSLYGQDRVEFNPEQGGSRLHLHASKLEFRHPRTRVVCTHSSAPDWL